MTAVGDAGFWRGRPTLVTGGSGLLGRWLIALLRERGAEVTCLVRPRSDSEAMPAFGPGWNGVRLFEADVTDQERLEHAVHQHRIDTVMHLAAQTLVGAAGADPAGVLDTNVRGTWTVLEACRRRPAVRQIVVASSDKAYGASDRLPYEEDAPLRGAHPYEVSKSCADLIAQSYALTYGMPVAITRCGNFYGGGDLHWERIVPGTIRAALRAERPVIRTDGRATRDFLYVEDGAAAYALLAEQLARRPELRGEAFNFSTNEETSVVDLVKRILALMGSDLQPVVEGAPSREIPRQVASTEKARRLLDWQPRFTLDEGLRRTIEWYRHHLRRKAAPAPLVPGP